MNMLARRMKTRKKGIEPIVAAILLIAIAIVAGTLLYIWVSKLTTSPSTGTTVSSQLQVLGISYSSSSKTITAYIKSPVNLTSVASITVYVYDTNGNFVAAASCSAKPYTADVYKVTCQLSSTLNAGTYYAVFNVANVGSTTSPTFTVS